MKFLSALMAAMAVSLLAPAAAIARQAETPPATAPAPAASSPVETPPAPKATAEQIAAATAEADAVIARFGVADLFENVTDSNVPKIRHRASGLRCGFDPGTEISVQIYDGLPRGDDISCGTTTLGITQTLYATRYPQKPTALQIVQSSLVAMKQHFKNLKDYTGTSVSMQRDGAGLPKMITARLTGKLGGKAVFTRSSAVVVGDWVFAQRVTGPVDKALTADILAEMNMTLLLIELAPAAPETPAPAGQPGS